MTTRIPANDELEAAFLGTLLVHQDAIDEHSDACAQLFFNPKHKAVWAAMVGCEMGTAGDDVNQADLLPVADWLQAHGRLEAVGGLAFLGELLCKARAAENLARYRELLERWQEKRDVLQAGLEITEKAQAFDAELDDHECTLTDWAISELEKSATVGARGASSLEWAKRTAKGLDDPEPTDCAKTGLASLDALLSLAPGDLTILAARPAMGKTALAMHIADAVASQGRPVAVYSLEQNGEQLFGRRACARAGVDTRWLRDHNRPAESVRAVTGALAALAQLPIWLDDEPSLSLRQLRSKAKRAKRALAIDRPGLVIVDYLQLMEGSQKRNATREQDVSAMSRGCKQLARELGWTVLALCQLNRSLESRTDKRPQLADLRESGAIEQDADQVVMLYRDVLYDPKTREPEVAELILRKNRHGAIGTAKVHFHGHYTRFSELSWRDSYPMPGARNDDDQNK